MAVEENKKNDEAEIQRLLDDGIRSLRDKNIEGIMSLYAPEVVTFDIVPRCATWEQMHSGNFGKRHS
jgi:ketosteroid isomerase-like protein